ncbi:MAG TPA: hypothetical protein VFK08_08765, partial [Rhodanobacteraceae bacterium]|nr:hypothetical protein [Rhodanobacteraceae bacterium]HET7611295.1 hypothetical protein [Rhodanobacteraceae bacterium]
VMKIARVRSYQPPLDWPGVHQAAVVTLWLTVGFTVLGVVLWLAGRAGLPLPDIHAWIDRKEPAFESPKLLARFRR